MSDSKEAEIRYFAEMSAEGRTHAGGKPFSDEHRGAYLIDLGQILSLIPPPPARLLDLGCGSGWTTGMFALSGYSALGVDLAPAAIELAREKYGPTGARFEVGDFESLPYDSEFDVAVFYDSLHHSNDVHASLAAAHRTLVNGGALIVVEPGKGHSRSQHSRTMIEHHGLTENDMLPKVTARILRKIGFRDVRIHQRLSLQERTQEGWKVKTMRRLLGRHMAGILRAARGASKARVYGVVTARK